MKAIQRHDGDRNHQSVCNKERQKFQKVVESVSIQSSSKTCEPSAVPIHVHIISATFLDTPKLFSFQTNTQTGPFSKHVMLATMELKTRRIGKIDDPIARSSNIPRKKKHCRYLIVD